MRLILMRHGKSDWSGPTEPDRARPLNARGRRHAALMGDWLRAQGYLPDQVLCSTSVRTRETLQGLALGDVPVSFEDRLYHAAPDTLWDSLHEAQGQTVLIIGHNPGMAIFAADLVARAPDHPRFRDYPTCATLVADFPVDSWFDVLPSRAQVQAFVIPREVEAG